MASHSSSSYVPLPSPSSTKSSLRSYQRPYQCSIDSNSTTTSPAKFDQHQHSSRSNIPQRCATTEPSSNFMQDTSHYSRRQLSIEAVQCIFVDESHPYGTLYTFLVKPTLLQTTRGGAARSKQRRADGARRSEQVLRAGEDNDEIPEQQQELEPYQIKKTSKELLELSNHLTTSFDILLDPRRGGPIPLSKELLLPKWNVKDIFRRKKKGNTVHETILAEATNVAKKDVINEFFLKVLRTGGEVLSSSRAMQDFFDKGRSVVKVIQRDERPVIPTRRPARPVLSALLIDESPLDEATENLTASPSWQSTPLSTPISAAASESKLRLWRKMQGEGTKSTPTQKEKARSLHHSASFSDACLVHSEIMMAIDADETSASIALNHSSKTQAQIHSLARSISQQDLQSELTSWRQEVNRASHQRTRKVSEASSMDMISDHMTHSAQIRHIKPIVSPNAKLECQSAQLRQVSGVAVKAKASGWKIIKGNEINTAVGQQIRADQREMLHNTPSRMASSDMARQSHSSIAASLKSNNVPYIPSELEKLIFGNANRREDEQHRTDSYHGDQYDLDCTEDEEYMGQEGERMSSEQTSTCSSIQSEQIASYKVKGRATVLRLNLAGRSNLHSESMIASAPVCRPKDNTSVLISSDRNACAQAYTDNSQDSWLDPDMSSSPRNTISSTAEKLNHSLKTANSNISISHENDRYIGSEVERPRNLRSLTLATRGYTSTVGAGMMRRDEI